MAKKYIVPKIQSIDMYGKVIISFSSPIKKLSLDELKDKFISVEKERSL